MSTGVIDYKKDPCYRAGTVPEIIIVPRMLFVMVDGKGAPEASGIAETEFQRAMQAIYGIIYTIKFWDKKFTPPKDYAKFTMPPVEGLWWMKDGGSFDMKKPDDWRWTLMHRVPEFVTPAFFDKVVRTVCEQKKSDVYKNARLEAFEEGRCVQIMHFGPYAGEQVAIDAMHTFTTSQGYKLHGKHHELYFNDPRRVAPEKVKTLLRHPVIDG